MSIIIFCSSCILADSECCNAALYEPANHITLFSVALAAETQCLFCSLFPIKRELRIHILTGFILSPLLCCKLTTYNIAVSSMQVATLWHCVIITTIFTISSNIFNYNQFLQDKLLVNSGIEYSNNSYSIQETILGRQYRQPYDLSGSVLGLQPSGILF